MKITVFLSSRSSQCFWRYLWCWVKLPCEAPNSLIHKDREKSYYIFIISFEQTKRTHIPSPLWTILIGYCQTDEWKLPLEDSESQMVKELGDLWDTQQSTEGTTCASNPE